MATAHEPFDTSLPIRSQTRLPALASDPSFSNKREPSLAIVPQTRDLHPRPCSCWPQESSLRELGLGGYYFHHDRIKVISSMLTPLEGSHRESGTGAQLRVLEMDTHMDDIQVLVEAPADKWCQLGTVSLFDLNHATMKHLIQYLPGITSLRDLNVRHVCVSAHHVWGDCNLSTLLQGLSQNGSLQTVSVGSVSGDELFRPADLLRIQSYCDRNRWATGLLQKLDAVLDEDGLMCSKDATFLSLCPSLLRAVKPAGRMAPSAVVCGLLACNEAIGHLRRVKRIGS
jgi:hypothetical protein